MYWVFSSVLCITTIWALGLPIPRDGSQRFVSGMGMEN